MKMKQVLQVLPDWLPTVIIAVGLIILSSIPGLNTGYAWDTPARKMVHFFAYFMLFICVNKIIFKKINHRAAALFLSFLLVFLFAISDEYHQLFVATRDGSRLDVLIDSLGASLGVAIVLFKRDDPP